MCTAGGGSSRYHATLALQCNSSTLYQFTGLISTSACCFKVHSGLMRSGAMCCGSMHWPY